MSCPITEFELDIPNNKVLLYLGWWKEIMKKVTLITLIFLSFFCFGFTGKIYTDDTGIYKKVQMEYRGNKLILLDWESGNVYEFEYYGKGGGGYRGYDWDNDHVLEMSIQNDGKGSIHNCDTGYNYNIDLGNLKRLKR